MEKGELIKKILRIELEMFKEVRADGPNPFQENPGGLLLARGAAFVNWSEEALANYLKDLQQAQQDERNLMTEKFARMDDLIPCLNENPLIDRIVEIEAAWETEVREKYPHIFGWGSKPDLDKEVEIADFENYLRCELETYSNDTLSSYFKNLHTFLGNLENLAEKTFTYIFRKRGFASLEEADAHCARSMQET
jgi:hypothetical protein